MDRLRFRCKKERAADEGLHAFPGLISCRTWGSARASLVGLDDLVRSRMAMLHSSTFLVRRAAIALAAVSGVVKAESVLGALHRRGRGI